MRRALPTWMVLLMLAAIALAAGVACGSSGCFPAGEHADLVWQLRLPRALGAFAVGGLLALAGALLQLLLRNPLADPYVLGVSGGAATGALAMLLLVPVGLVERQWLMPLGAILGALLAVALLFGLARRALLRVTPFILQGTAGVRLILTGVMIAAGFGAVLTLMLSIAPDAQLRGMVFWLMGDLEGAEWYGLGWAVLLLACLWAARNAGKLNVLAHGETAAHLLGVPVVRLRQHALLVASMATAAAVALAGTIGFVGLVVPHALRLVIGNDQRMLLPASMLAGGGALTLADLAARTVVAPLQLPVGVVTALVGVPVFLYLLGRGRT